MTVTSLTDELLKRIATGELAHTRSEAEEAFAELLAARAELTDLRERLGSLAAEPNALKDVAAERKRQVEAEGWTPEHDDQHRTGQMADAAARYAVAGGGTFPDERTAFLWPWAGSWWKPGDKRRNLVKAGALILAEIERLDRLAAKGGVK